MVINKKTKIKRNKYEQKIMIGCIVFKIFFILEVIFFIASRFIMKPSIPLTLLFFISIPVAAKAVAGGYGYFNQKTPIWSFTLARGGAAIYTLAFRLKDTTLWILIGIGVVLDWCFILYLLRDKANYVYESE